MLENYDGQMELGHAQIGLCHWLDRKSYEQELRKFFVGASFGKIDPKGEAKVYLEKTPNNARLLPVINTMFEDVLVLHVIRDPVQVVDSLIRASKGWGESWATKSVRKATRSWIKAVSSACRDGRRMGPRYFEFGYDRLMGEPDWLLGEIFDRLELEYDERVISDCITQASDTSDLPKGFVSGNSTAQALGRINRWRVRRRTKSVVKEFGLSFR